SSKGIICRHDTPRNPPVSVAISTSAEQLIKHHQTPEEDSGVVVVALMARGHWLSDFLLLEVTVGGNDGMRLRKFYLSYLQFLDPNLNCGK
ncbi:MAG: hypothetical protein LH679_07820, partial [Cyanobacteria bacterium CAN_BIN43]|nr:hypothetical protein [Cyanobacteria bacterium CAN_BIN43]